MKFIHTADLHLGKLVQSTNMTEDQAIVLDELLEVMNQQKVDVLVIAGDVYDRSIPTLDAVSLFNTFLDKAINQYHKKILLISGNHDGSDRLDFASTILSQQGLYIESFISKEIKKITFTDEHGPLNFYLLPFFKPSLIRSTFEEESITEFDQAMRYYLSKQSFDFTQRNVLITHQFVAGSEETIVSDSEQAISVGGTSIIGVDAFKDFDYVALGHLHAPQSFSKQKVAYSGSLLKYSASEAKQKKSISLIEIKQKGDLVSTPITLHPKRDLRVLKGSFNDLCKQPLGNNEDYVVFELTDMEYIPNAMEKARIVYPNILNITYPTRDNKQESGSMTLSSLNNVKDEYAVFQDFYKEIQGSEMSQEMLDILKEIIDQMKGDQQ
jgi:DNA repair protein SbcD/Mre11